MAQLFDAYRVFYGQAANAELARRFLVERLTRADAAIFVAVTPDARIAGFATLYELFSLVRAGRHWLLEDLFVAESARRGGIASALMARAETFARATGAVGLTLSTHYENASAQSLYERCGYLRDRDFLVYNRRLEAPD